MITNQPVINLGISGNGPITELGLLREYAKFLQPKKVIWIYCDGNDIDFDLPREKSIQLLMKYLDLNFSQNLINRQDEIDKQITKYITAEKKKERKDSYKYNWMRLQILRELLGFHSYNNTTIEIDPLFFDILRMAKSEVSSWGGKLYFVYLPEYSRYKKLGIDHELYKKRAEVISKVEKLDIHVIDLHKEVFEKTTDPLSFFPFRLPGHYNRHGYRGAAKAIVSNSE